MSLPVARGTADSTTFNTIARNTLRLFFQKSPGKPRGDKRGILDLEFRVEAGSLIRTGRAPATGEVVVPLEAGKAAVVLLNGGQDATTYLVTADEAPFEPMTTVLGQEQRLRHLGYQLGHEGPDGDGVGPDPPPINITPRPPRVPDPEEDDDDRELAARRLKERKDNPAIKEENFQELTFRTERSFLDFQADAGVVIDGRMGPISQNKLKEATGE